MNRKPLAKAVLGASSVTTWQEAFGFQALKLALRNASLEWENAFAAYPQVEALAGTWLGGSETVYSRLLTGGGLACIIFACKSSSVQFVPSRKPKGYLAPSRSADLHTGWELLLSANQMECKYCGLIFEDSGFPTRNGKRYGLRCRKCCYAKWPSKKGKHKSASPEQKTRSAELERLRVLKSGYRDTPASRSKRMRAWRLRNPEKYQVSQTVLLALKLLKVLSGMQAGSAPHGLLEAARYDLALQALPPDSAREKAASFPS